MQKKSKNKSIGEALPVWLSIKAKYRDAIVLVRTNDVYLSFGKDAKMVNIIAGVQLQPFKQEEFQCTIEFVDLDMILNKLVKSGYKTAICDPLSK